MAIVPLKCPKCGSIINLDDQQETSTCEYCGGQFPFQEAVQKYIGELAGKLTPDEAQSGNQVFSTEPIPGYDLPENAVQAIRLLAANNQKIHAIKVFREFAKVDLKEAKDAIDRLETTSPVTGPVIQNSNNVIIQTAGTAELDSNTIPGYTLDSKIIGVILSFLAKKQKIAAIKVFRDATNADLKESKDAIDSLDARHPHQNSSTDYSSPKNRAKDPSVKVSKCYIATAVYGSYDAPRYSFFVDSVTRFCRNPCPAGRLSAPIIR